MDTVWKPFDDEFVANLKKEIDLKDIDYIVMNHNENDHSGALPALMREIPDTPIYCTKKEEAILRGLYHRIGTSSTSRPAIPDSGDSQLVFIKPLCSIGRIRCSRRRPAKTSSSATTVSVSTMPAKECTMTA